MSSPRFSYERLRVHSDILRFLAAAESHFSAWDPIHAIVDQFNRASEGMYVNLAEASRAHTVGAKTAATDYCLGSVLECCACMDIAHAKQLIDEASVRSLKSQMTAIFRQLIGLRASWQKPGIAEARANYGDDKGFGHEQLDAYQLALQAVRRLEGAQLLERLSRAAFRRIDEPATSIVLNIAEGNGRFAHLDHHRFLEIANRANTKLAARLDLGTLYGDIEEDVRDDLKVLLVRIDAMTAALARKWRSQS